MLGIPLRSLRRLCTQGLIPGVKRDHSRQRVFTEQQLNLAKTLFSMREYGFKSRDVRKYAALYRQGASTKAERKALLDTRKRQIWQEIETRQAAIDFIERQDEYLA